MFAFALDTLQIYTSPLFGQQYDGAVLFRLAGTCRLFRALARHRWAWLSGVTVVVPHRKKSAERQAWLVAKK